MTPEVKSGSEIEIEIAITNISDKVIAIPYPGYHGALPDGFKFDVRDEQDAPVASFGKRFVKLPNEKTFQLPARLPGSLINGEIKI
ncbi:MAG: hypothetical protein ABSG62_05175 [Terracidiphilus sp.]